MVELKNIAPNFHTVTIGNATLYFSYETVIAFKEVNSQGVNLTVRENIWNKTTGKHLNKVDGGTKEAKSKRLTSSGFTLELNKMLKGYKL